MHRESPSAIPVIFSALLPKICIVTLWKLYHELQYLYLFLLARSADAAPCRVNETDMSEVNTYVSQRAINKPLAHRVEHIRSIFCAFCPGYICFFSFQRCACLYKWHFATE